ncbi:MAG: carbon starvation protein A [Acidobacteria bacterium]|nr:MAG: carbon starvation protein A [Acidobacteriota bacterium]
MPAMYIIIPVLGVLAIAYRFYSAFVAAKIMMIDDRRITPAHTKEDGHNFHPTSRWVLFGHHFAAITGAGPLIGPVLAAQFGYAPGLIWIVAGVCLAGAVHDMLILWASTRRGGASLASIARSEIGSVAGTTCAIAILFVVVVALAGLGLAVVNALQESAWGVFTIGLTIPIAIFMGLYTKIWRPGKTTEATVIGVTALILAVILGKPIAASSIGHYFLLTRQQLVITLGVYGFFASVLPVWLLLAPRDYLSSFMKIGTIGFLIIGVIIVNPHLQMPAFSSYIGGGGPIIPGTLFPFAFITIACGAISGFHGLIGSGTTPKMIDKESDIRPIGYGAMLMEGVVGVMALIAACSLQPQDYFAINTSPAVYSNLNSADGTPMQVVNLPELQAEVGETVQGRPGGAVSLAVGMAQIFSKLPGMRGMMDYWYHFAIMFEALFILTTIDAGTRVARFLVGEFLGRASPATAKFGDHAWMPGAMISTGLVVFSWGYFIWVGSISTIWPMFGIANQLLAAISLAIATTIIMNSKKAKYAWITLVPFVFLATNTLVGGWMSVRDNFWPLTNSGTKALRTQGYVDTVCTIAMMICVLIIIGAAIRRWIKSMGPEPGAAQAAAA